MRYPAFVAEIGRDENRAKIQLGIYTGYATALLFGGLLWYAAEHGIVVRSPGIPALVLVKLCTNTLSWIGLRTRVRHLELAALNITADLLVMTGAVYYTGGPNSPLAPIYFIEATVMALLTNVGLTVLVTAAAFVLFAGMSLLVQGGVLALYPTPYQQVGALSPSFVAVTIAAFGVLIAVPGAYVALIVQRLREKEAALEERARELVEAAKAKSQFMANLTHELRTPLHGILGLSDLLAAGIYGPINERQREGVEGVQQSAKNLLELIDGLLLLARAEAAKLEVTVATVDIADVVDSVAATGRSMRGRKDLRIDVEVAPDLPAVQTDRGKLVQILINLLANAIKFTPEGGRVAMRATPDGDGVRLAVSDTGIGIPEAERAHIFEAFHQVDGSTSRDYGGAGLGLSLVQKLAALLGAEVTVASTEGEGSTFTVRLPERPPGR